jgi:carbonic anhydrase/acetyltransferase-like protein (isoleucine patch superfamily)
MPPTREEIPLLEFGPLVSLDRPAFIHDSVNIYGANRISEGVSIWPRVVMRAEMFENVIGPFSNLQDFVMVHVGEKSGTTVGAYSSIAHRATVHGCTIGDNCLIGINATIMDGAVIGDNTIVAGHSIVTAGTVIPANCIAAGVPAKVIKQNRNNFVANRMNALIYHRNALAYARGEHRAWDGDAANATLLAEQERVASEFAALQAADGGDKQSTGG